MEPVDKDLKVPGVVFGESDFALDSLLEVVFKSSSEELGVVTEQPFW